MTWPPSPRVIDRTQSGRMPLAGGRELNAVEIEEAISQLADQTFDPGNFPYAFLEAFGNKETTTIKRLRTGASNKSDLSDQQHSHRYEFAAQRSVVSRDTGIPESLQDSFSGLSPRSTKCGRLHSQIGTNAQTNGCEMRDWPRAVLKRPSIWRTTGLSVSSRRMAYAKKL